MPRRRTPSSVCDRIDQALRQREALDRELAALEVQKLRQDREDDVRARLLMGGLILGWLQDDPALAKRLRAALPGRMNLGPRSGSRDRRIWARLFPDVPVPEAPHIPSPASRAPDAAPASEASPGGASHLPVLAAGDGALPVSGLVASASPVHSDANHG